VFSAGYGDHLSSGERGETCSTHGRMKLVTNI
jgi:hypothetical protein